VNGVLEPPGCATLADVGRINQAALNKMLRDIDQAVELGHSCGEVVPVRQTKTQFGWACACSCGWQSNSRKRKIAAISLGYMHVKDVLEGHVDPLPASTTLGVS
jgi:hypothetical protein